MEIDMAHWDASFCDVMTKGGAIRSRHFTGNISGITKKHQTKVSRQCSKSRSKRLNSWKKG